MSERSRLIPTFLPFHVNTDQTSRLRLPFLHFCSLICFYLRPAVPTTVIGALHPPPPQLAVQRPFPSSGGGSGSGGGGRPFLSTTLLIFHRETSPFFHSPDFPAGCQRLSRLSVFLLPGCFSYVGLFTQVMDTC